MGSAPVVGHKAQFFINGELMGEAKGFSVCVDLEPPKDGEEHVCAKLSGSSSVEGVLHTPIHDMLEIPVVILNVGGKDVAIGKLYKLDGVGYELRGVSL